MANNKPVGIAYSDPDLTSLTLNGTLVTATAAELNTNAGVTAGTAAASKTVVLDANSKIGGIDLTNPKVNGNNVFGSVAYDRASKIARVALAAVRTGGGVFAWANPEAGAILVSRVVLDITTQSTGASTIDVGYTATSATTSADTAIDGVSGATAGVFDNIEDQGTNGKSSLKMAAGKWITASEASGDVTGLAGFAYIHYNLI